MPFAKVYLDVPIQGPFDYLCNSDDLEKGTIVIVPFGKRRMLGIVDEVVEISNIDSDKVRAIESVLGISQLPLAYLSFCKFVANYYCSSLGQTLFLGLPSALINQNIVDRLYECEYSLTEVGREQIPLDLKSRAMGKRRLFELLLGRTSITIAEGVGCYSSAKKQMLFWAERGWLDVSRHPKVSKRFDKGKQDKINASQPRLTEGQKEASQRISESFGAHKTWLLHGVTGSGKTEVYFKLIERVLESNQQVLVLVPEINLTPQLESRLHARFGQNTIVTLNSRLAKLERASAWYSATRGEASIVIGTRLAVFTPLPKLGLVIVDEEHDTSYKQMEGVRYNARDLAIYRGATANVPVILGSATPSLETYLNVIQERFERLSLPERPKGPKPDIRLINIEHNQSDQVADEILAAIERRLVRHEQVMIFINRRGYAPVLFCPSCRWMASCSNCSARLTFHKSSRRLRCHYCGHQEKIPSRCGNCGNQDIVDLGQGTERVVESLERRFSGARIVRIDSDTTSRKGAFAAFRDDIESSKVDLIVGTQMLAKGHDFPNLSLVVVLGADQGLFSSDFRSTERMFQQLLQVSGRAGRGGQDAEVLIQTEFADHPIYLSLKAQSFDDFAKRLLDERREVDFPPFSHQALLRAAAKVESKVWGFLFAARKLGLKLNFSQIDVYDAVPAPIFKQSGLFRGQVLVQSNSRPKMRKFLTKWLRDIETLNEKQVRYAIDVDPLDV